MKKRVISLFLVLAIFITTFAVTTTSSMAAPTCYQQGDSRWGGVYIGKWTIAESGCGILSTVNTVNYQTGRFINPVELASWAHSKNYYNGSYGQGSVRWTMYANMTAAFGSKYGFKVTGLQDGSITSPALINHLKSGGSVIVHVPNHFMAINGYNSATGQYLVYDSSAAAKRNTSVYGSWLTAAQLNSNSLTRVDWFCLVTRVGAAATTTTTTTTTTTSTAATTKTYTVSASVASGSGTVHFGNNVKSAKVAAGTTVNYQVTPASGYYASKILVGGTAQTIKNNGGNAVYQFTMPKGDCGVVVTFTKVATSKTYTVSASKASGSGTVHFGNNVTSAKVAAGTVVNYQVTPASGYYASKILVGGTAQTIKNNGGNAVYQFTMPQGDCGVVVTFSKVGSANKTYKVSASVASGSGTVHFGNNVKSANVAAGTVINYQTTPAAGYKVSKILVGGTSQTIKNNGADAVYQFTMPQGDCGVVVTFTKISTTGTYKVRVGTFSSYSNATAYVTQLQKAGFSAYVGTVSGKYVVYAGTFSSKTNADKLVSQLKAKGFSAYVSTT